MESTACLLLDWAISSSLTHPACFCQYHDPAKYLLALIFLEEDIHLSLKEWDFAQNHTWLPPWLVYGVVIVIRQMVWGWWIPIKYSVCLTKGRWAAPVRRCGSLTLLMQILWLWQRWILPSLMYTQIHTHRHHAPDILCWSPLGCRELREHQETRQFAFSKLPSITLQSGHDGTVMSYDFL